jgi:translation elongation factor EF-Tu-like GTPase
MLKKTKTKVLGIEGYGQMKEAWAGDNVGVLLDKNVKLEDVKRGDIIVSNGILADVVLAPA